MAPECGTAFAGRPREQGAPGLALSQVGVSTADQGRKEPSYKVNSVRKGMQLIRQEPCSGHQMRCMVSVGETLSEAEEWRRLEGKEASMVQEK